ncbi:MAG: acyl-CoA dehydrogenase family protein [Proteobacteria bacterium]|nr:acyl-CoA dehydrogenase family protein [Pseudomonadota bacterium]
MSAPASESFGLTGEQQSVLDAADRYARTHLYPLAARMDLEEWWPAAAFAALGPAGLLGITVPAQYGGAGMDLFASGLVLQGLARWNHALALSWVAHDNLCVNNILRNASPAQRERFLPALCSGRQVGALGLTEPGAGSDAVGSMSSRATRAGDHYLLNGSKIFITNGPVADILLVYARTDPQRGAQGISAFVIEKDFPGFHVAQTLTKMGFRGSQTGELVFQDCRVPLANRIGEENEGIAVLMSGLDLERAMIAPLCLGVAERALALCLQYARERRQFGRPIGDFQMIRGKLADLYVTVETMRTFTYRVLAAANVLEVGGGGRGGIHALTAAAVLHAAEGMNRVLSEALQIHGGSGYLWEAEINRLFRATKLLEIGAGTSEIRRLIIAGELLDA